jgi:hypothetical protein
MPIVYGVSQEGVSETVAQVGRSLVGARNELAVTAGSLGLANDGSGLKAQVETTARGGARIGGKCWEEGRNLPGRPDGRSRRLGVDGARNPFFLAFRKHARSV